LQPAALACAEQALKNFVVTMHLIVETFVETFVGMLKLKLELALARMLELGATEFRFFNPPPRIESLINFAIDLSMLDSFRNARTRSAESTDSQMYISLLSDSRAVLLAQAAVAA
jgi:hypothetical protein